jgi:2-polyprenyl-6-methoxyphenol hydroxylase-like FAD-dependent oxidoreductase
MLACELALSGAKARLLEERTDTSNITRAFAVHARTLGTARRAGSGRGSAVEGRAGASGRADELGVEIFCGAQVVDVTQDGDGSASTCISRAPLTRR